MKPKCLRPGTKFSVAKPSLPFRFHPPMFPLFPHDAVTLGFFGFQILCQCSSPWHLPELFSNCHVPVLDFSTKASSYSELPPHQVQLQPCLWPQHLKKPFTFYLSPNFNSL